MTPRLPAYVKWWPPHLREWHAELAAQIEVDGRGCSREEADAEAERLLRERHARLGDGPVWTTKKPAVPGALATTGG